jgi:hypothetical protein
VGGGGAGGLLLKENADLTIAGGTISLIVGTGGQGGAVTTKGFNGTDSSIGNYLAKGGAVGAGGTAKHGDTVISGGAGWHPEDAEGWE